MDPAGQANDTAFFLRKVFLEDPHTADCLIRHAVWFPSGSLPGGTELPFDYHPEMTFDIADLRQPEQAVGRAFAYWNTTRRHELTDIGAERLLRRLLPTVAIVPSVRARLEDRERALVQLTQEQARLIDFLDDQRVAVIAGVAGTGKTLLGLEKARRLADRGGTVAFLCFNSALRNYLAATQQHPGVEFHTFHSLARAHAGAGEPDAVASRFVEFLSRDGDLKFDHLVVDEGQDFDTDWLDWLAARVEGSFYVFYDRNQLVQRDRAPEWLERAECRLVLRRNVRNTTSIAKFATRCASVSAPAPDSVPGPRPHLHRASDREAALAVADRLVSALTRGDRLPPHEVAVISLEGADGSMLSTLSRLGGQAVVAEPTPGSVTVTTVRRFKGLEAAAVVVVDVDPRKFADTAWRRLLYVAASRARQVLHVVMTPADDDAVAVAVRAIDDTPQRAPTLRSLEKLLHAKIAENADDPFAE